MWLLHKAKFLQEYFLWQGSWAGKFSLCSICLTASTSAVHPSVLLCSAYSRGLNTLECMPLI
jgi:hypothetical protein